MKDYIVMVNWGDGATDSMVIVVTASSQAGARKKALVYADRSEPLVTATIMGDV